MSLQAVLAKYKEISSSKREKGDFFERLMKAYLLKAPKYSATIKEVWLWNDFPFKKEFGTGKDVGVDLVAKTYSGEYWAIQCKFYERTTRINKEDVDTFLATSGRQFHDEKGQARQFANRLWIATSDNWSKEADEVRKGQTINFSQITLYDLENEPIDWEALANGAPSHEVVCNKRELRDHQKEALNRFHEHFQYADRGRLIMACGTGKTFTSLRIAENETASSGLVLFLVPSIALLGQTLNEWTNYAQKTIKPICVCSDATASKKKKSDDDGDESVADLALPASTDVENIAKQLKERLQENTEGMTVVFSTYQSIERVHEAQQLLNKEKPDFYLFDLIICDEAHRTTGVALKAQTAKGYKYDESAFIKVHDNEFIQARKRIYMTATPRLYREDVKTKAKAQDAYLCSMDDEALYGPEVYRIGFGEAVKKGLLSDYKVMVLTIDDQKIPAPLQEAIANKSGEIEIDSAAKLIGCINALSKNFALEGDLVRNTDPGLMHTAVAFCQDIKTSKKIAEVFNKYQADCSQALSETENVPLVEVQADHVDGSMGAVDRQKKLSWLKNVDSSTKACHILTNVRCLSEGVDVPSLDAVLFLSARNSQVDVVQSVGRVMRRAAGKKYGYIVIPVVVPHDVAPEDVLNGSKSFEVVWSVLNALRAHDDRFNAEVNKIEFNKLSAEAVAKGSAFSIGGVADANDHILIDTVPNPKGVQTELNYGDMRNAIYARLVKKVGNRRYWEEWAQDVAHIAEEHIKRINKLIAEDEVHKEAFDQFLSGLRKNLNPSVSQDDAVEMLAQHIVTKPVFEALFENYSFAKNNPVSISMQKLIDLLHEDIPAAESDVMVKFYKQVAERIEGVNSAEGRQKIIIELYDKFFRAAFPKTVEKLGIVYTPVEVVDFIIYSVADLWKKEFGGSISDQGVHIIDPFVGTGTFIARLLQSGLIRPEDLERKYTKELHANELVLLAYYIASVNIENVYHDQCKNKETYHPFEGICLTDTFQLSESDQQEHLYAKELAQNSERVIAQQKAPIQIIIGNPPYSVGQKSANDNAQNQKYPHLDSRIADTYAQASKSTNKNSLYDSYIKAFRWASDRLDPQTGGIIAFVSNGAWIDGNASSGFRKCLEDEFYTLYVFNLRASPPFAFLPKILALIQRKKSKNNYFSFKTKKTRCALYLL
ncbi:MAG: DEAD/DEAH box helicase family protein [Candidatus Bruticola sp.]